MEKTGIIVKLINKHINSDLEDGFNQSNKRTMIKGRINDGRSSGE